MKPTVDPDDLAQTIGRLVEVHARHRDSFAVAPGAKIDPARDHGGKPTAASPLRAARVQPASGFEVGAALGQGGMGVVRAAKQLALNRDVAIKTIKPKLASEAATRMLLQEALVLGRLDHPNILPIHDIRHEDGEPRIVLKKIEGVEWGSLMHRADVLREEFGVDDPLVWNVEILMTVCNAVHFAHSRGVVHRDLKPENVMIGQFGEVYVMDWGLALCLDDDGTDRYPLARDATQLAGTPQYMAPEMLGAGLQPITERTDVYLLGAILYEIIAGHAPHRGRDMNEMLGHVLVSRPEIPASCPSELSRICRMAMDREPAWRFESVEALRVALAAFQKHADSRRLAEQALGRTEQLVSQLRGSTTRADQERVESLFAECRFGFRQALEGWPENDVAKSGLSRASIAMIEYALSQHNARSAAALLRTLDAAPAELRERVELAVREVDAQDARLADLERLRKQLDMRTGGRSRAIGAGLIGLFGACVPALSLYQRYFPGLGRLPNLLLPLFMMIAFGMLARVARGEVRESSVTRRMMRAASVVMAGQLALEGAAYALGLNAARTEVLWLLVWFSVGAMLASTVDRRLYPMTVGFLGALLVSSFRPEWRYYAMGASSLIMGANTFFLWMPGLQRKTRDPLR